MPSPLACLISAIYVLLSALMGTVAHKGLVMVWNRRLEVAVRSFPEPSVSPSPSDSPPPPPPPVPRMGVHRTYKGTNPKPVAAMTVSQVRRPNGAVLYAQNQQTCPLTVTIEYTERRNANSRPPFPRTVELPGRAKIKIGEIVQVNRYQSWNFRYQYRWVRGSYTAVHDSSAVYRLPFEPGTKVVVASTHYGDVYSYSFVVDEDTPVLAARSGKVVYTESRYDVHGTTSEFTKRVNEVVVQHDDRTLACYTHLRPQGVAVSVGQRVETGQLLGYSGNTGYSNYPQLGFWVMRPRNGNAEQTFELTFELEDGEEPLEPGTTYTVPDF